jgi:hypothetical protein
MIHRQRLRFGFRGSSVMPTMILPAEQVVQLPDMVRQLRPHGWRAADRRMNPAEVVVEDMQRHGRLPIGQHL